MLKKLLCILVCLLFIGCGKTEHGCRDKDAENYEPEAEEDCGCCIFYGRAFIYFTYDYYDNVIYKKVSQFNVFVNGKLYKRVTRDLDDWQRSAPLGEVVFSNYNGIEGTDDNVVNLSLGDKKSELINLSITNEYGNQLFAANVLLKANRIISVEMR